MRRVLLAVFSTIAGLVMLLSFKTQAIGTAALPAAIGTTGPVDPATPATTPSPTATADSGDAAAGATASPTPAATTAGANGTYTGAAADTRYGPVQVQITVTDGRVTAATAVDYPTNNGRDQEINARAIPTLDAEATQAGTTNIDTVSGATYTSDGYLQSLQSALDQAGL